MSRSDKRPEDWELNGVELTPGQIEAFLDSLGKRGRSPGTLEKYRGDMYLFYQDLPDEKRLSRESLRRWQETMLSQGYAPRTVNARISAVNSLLAFLDRRDLQLVERLPAQEVDNPPLTRDEYCQLLSTARTLGRERIYLLVKLLGSTGLSVQDLDKVTVEALVDRGQRFLSQSQAAPVPQELAKQLLDYARRTGVTRGPVFVTRLGTPLRRGNVADAIKRLCRDAQVPLEKGTCRNLKRLCRDTLAAFRDDVDVLVEQAYDRLLLEEELYIQWREK